MSNIDSELVLLLRELTINVKKIGDHLDKITSNNQIIPANIQKEKRNIYDYVPEDIIKQVEYVYISRTINTWPGIKILGHYTWDTDKDVDKASAKHGIHNMFSGIPCQKFGWSVIYSDTDDSEVRINIFDRHTGGALNKCMHLHHDECFIVVADYDDHSYPVCLSSKVWFFVIDSKDYPKFKSSFNGGKTDAKD